VSLDLIVFSLGVNFFCRQDRPDLYSAIFKVSGILALICMSLGAKLSAY